MWETKQPEITPGVFIKRFLDNDTFYQYKEIQRERKMLEDDWFCLEYAVVVMYEG